MHDPLLKPNLANHHTLHVSDCESGFRKPANCEQQH
jgi:hypothetical protein